MSESIIDVSRDFFNEIVKPILEREFPGELAQMAFGVFGYGSEALRLDDEYSRDHHWGLRINALMPEALFQKHHTAILDAVRANLPSTYRGHALREGYTGTGLELDSLEGFLGRTVGLTHAPQTYAEWLSIPEEDITHIVNGEVWYDPSARFTAIRSAYLAYYPEPVRIRRLAHWCRYYSGMGTYALKRAVLRENELYETTTFARAIKLGVQIAFLLDKQYFPYDKWLLHYFERLPRLAKPLLPPVKKAVSLSTPWSEKLELLDRMSDILDETLVADGLIPSHPKFVGSASSGYRLMEHAYAELIKKSPPEIKQVVPVVDQIYLEEFHSGYVDRLDLATWDGLLNLKVSDDLKEREKKPV